MTDGITMVSDTNQRNLILFVHGFTGDSVETWTNGDEYFPRLLSQLEAIKESFDVGVFEYYTCLLESKVVLENISSKLIGLNNKNKKNISISEIANLLKNQLFIKKKYENIVIISHSMGGLVAKSLILDSIKEEEVAIALYISLAVPHQGTIEANIGSIVSSNVQVAELAALSDLIVGLNDGWIGSSNKPASKYLYGVSDNIVGKKSAIQLGADKEFDVHSISADHKSICKPRDIDDEVFQTVCKIIFNHFDIPNDLRVHSLNRMWVKSDDITYIRHGDVDEEVDSIYESGVNTCDIVNTLLEPVVEGSDSLPNEIKSALLKKRRGEVFLVHGEPGSGKSLAAHALAITCRRDCSKMNERVFFFDLMSFEKAISQGHSSDSMLESLSNSLVLIDDNEVNLLVIDGLDYLNKFSTDFAKGVIKYLSSNVSVFFKRDYKGISSIVSDNEIEDVIPNSEFNCGLDVSSSAGSDIFESKAFVSTYTKSNSNELSAAKHKMRDWFFENKNNIRLLNLLLKHESKPRDNDTAAKFMERFFTRYVKAYSLDADSINYTQNEAEKLAYGILVKGEKIVPSTSSEYLIKRISTQSFEMLGYLSARFICKEILSIADVVNRGEKPHTFEYIDAVYPYLINKYAKDIINQDRKSQGAYYNAIIVIYNYGSSKVKAFLCYLLGRVTNNNIKKKCEEFLILEKEKADKEEDLLLSIPPDSKFLVLHRTIYISLIYLQKASEDVYIKKILGNRNLDAVNRGFHRQYYGDGDYIHDRDMVSDDSDFGHFKNTYRQLSDKLFKIRENTKGTLNLSVCTLLSLTLSRLQHGTLDRTVPKKDVVLLINHVVNNIRGLSKFVVEYALTVKYYLLKDVKPVEESIYLMYRLKETPRNGWNYKSTDQEITRVVSSPESVSQHSDFTVRLAQVFLPENEQVALLLKSGGLDCEYEGYSKYRILSLLSVHDLGEYEHGDIVRMLQTPGDRHKEHVALKKLSIITACHSSKLLADPYVSIYSPWREHNDPKEITINHKVAKDIDNIECLIQLYVYKNRSDSSIQDADDFRGSLLDKVKTKLGKELVSVISLSSW